MLHHESKVYTEGSVRKTLCLLAILAVATSQAIGQGLVLCLCVDGYVSVETSCNPADCCPEDVAAKGEFSEALPDRTQRFDSDNSCVSIPLFVGADGAQNRRYSASQTRSAPHPAAAFASAQSWIESLREVGPATPTRGARACLDSIPSTVVLLI